MRTALYDKHCALGAKIVDFAGWEMPIQYSGIIQEHLQVRKNAGIFDVSHMGKIEIRGPDAEKLLDFLSTNAIEGKQEGSAIYTVWCDSSGHAIDDLMVYKKSAIDFFIVVNASNRQKDLEHLKKMSRSYNVIIEEKYADGILAIQGPNAQKILRNIFTEAADLLPMHFADSSYKEWNITLSCTGYTGSGGMEIYGPMPAIVDLWERFMEMKVAPIGLGARDTLRLEMGYALYGHELSEEIAATETVSAWTVKWKDRNFLGKEALLKLEKSHIKKHQYGVILEDPGIARAGYLVYRGNDPIGIVTSGTMSPSLNQAVAIILVERNLKENDNVEIQIRNNKCKARIVKLPFYHPLKEAL